MAEPFILCVPAAQAEGLDRTPGPDGYPEVALSAFRDAVFTLVKRSSTMRGMVDRMFAEAGFQPRLLFDSVSMRAMQKLAASGQCCCIIPRFYAVPCDTVRYFTLGPSARWELCAVWEQSRYLSRAARDVIDAAKSYWQTHVFIE